MNLVRRLLSHSLLILIAIGLIYAYIERDELYPYLQLSQDKLRNDAPVHGEPVRDKPLLGKPAQGEGDVAKIQTKTATPLQKSVKPVTTKADAGPSGHQETPLIVPDPVATDEAAEVSIVVSTFAGDGEGSIATTEDEQTTVGIEPATGGAGKAMHVSSSTPPTTSRPQTAPKVVSQTVLKKPLNTASATTVPASPPVAAPGNTGRLNDLLQRARQAYWQRDTTAAETLYRRAIKADPGQTDAYGELGNIYLSQARYQEAAEVYYVAASRLYEDGRVRQALSLLHIMYRLDPERASSLERTLRENGK